MAFRFYLPAIGWAIIVAILILLPGDELPDTGDIPGLDKVAHVGVFTILSLLGAIGAMKHKTASSLKMNAIFFSLISCIIYGIVLELIQGTVPDREFDLYDILANIGGVFLGMFAFKIIYKL